MAMLDPWPMPVLSTACQAVGRMSDRNSTFSSARVPGTLKGNQLGDLAFGRSQHPTQTALAQAYGLFDDVGVFDHALTSAELSALVANRRLTGSEPGLVAGWGFDVPTAGSLLPPKLAGAWDAQEIGPPLKDEALNLFGDVRQRVVETVVGADGKDRGPGGAEMRIRDLLRRGGRRHADGEGDKPHAYQRPDFLHRDSPWD